MSTDQPTLDVEADVTTDPSPASPDDAPAPEAADVESPSDVAPDSRDTADAGEAPEPDQPADVDPTSTSAEVVLATPKGSLTIRPNQTVLDAHQRASLVAIGIDVEKDPQVVPHVRPFIHMCQVKGLDPWSKEAYLIGRGKGQYRKFTMQTGIDGYRKIANGTKRFIRVKARLWTGQDDDDRSYVPVSQPDGSVVMARVWYDQWPASRGFPGAAKCTIEHYDDYGNVIETSAVADWSMYAPFNDKTEWVNNVKRTIRGDDGEPIQVLNDMWTKGYAHMLVKCAEALAHRIAFPASMSGIYTHEEMHRLDAQERQRMEAEQRAIRQEAYAAATGRSLAAAAPSVPADASGDDEPAPAGPMPMPVTQDVQDVVAAAAPTPPDASPEQQAEWLRAELEYQSGVLGHKPAVIAKRAMSALRKNVEDFTAAELAPVVLSVRGAVVARLREHGNDTEADLYAACGQNVVDVMAAIAGAEVEAEVVPEPVDPDAEHPFIDAPGGGCVTCGLPEDVGPHPE